MSMRMVCHERLNGILGGLITGREHKEFKHHTNVLLHPYCMMSHQRVHKTVS